MADGAAPPPRGTGVSINFLRRRPRSEPGASASPTANRRVLLVLTFAGARQHNVRAVLGASWGTSLTGTSGGQNLVHANTYLAIASAHQILAPQLQNGPNGHAGTRTVGDRSDAEAWSRRKERRDQEVRRVDLRGVTYVLPGFPGMSVFPSPGRHSVTRSLPTQHRWSSKYNGPCLHVAAQLLVGCAKNTRERWKSRWWLPRDDGPAMSDRNQDI